MATTMQPASSGRRRGRPVGSDSAETRAQILRAARDVINERGYEAATFQAIAARAGFSRPTMHYYFHTKEEIYESLQCQAHSVVSECIAAAKREATLLAQLAAFVAAHRRQDDWEPMMRFIITSRIDRQHSVRRRDAAAPVSDAVAEFYAWMVDGAIRRGEIPADVDATAVRDMLFAMFWGVGFFAGFVHGADDVMEIARQLNQLFRHGLLNTADSERVPRPAKPAFPTTSVRAIAFGA